MCLDGETLNLKRGEIPQFKTDANNKMLLNIFLTILMKSGGEKPLKIRKYNENADVLLARLKEKKKRFSRR